MGQDAQIAVRPDSLRSLTRCRHSRANLPSLRHAARIQACSRPSTSGIRAPCCEGLHAHARHRSRAAASVHLKLLLALEDTIGLSGQLARGQQEGQRTNDAHPQPSPALHCFSACGSRGRQDVSPMLVADHISCGEPIDDFNIGNDQSPSLLHMVELLEQSPHRTVEKICYRCSRATCPTPAPTSRRCAAKRAARRTPRARMAWQASWRVGATGAAATDTAQKPLRTAWPAPDRSLRAAAAPATR